MSFRDEKQKPILQPLGDPVNHPRHYVFGGIETIDFIEAKNLSYCLGNVIKYISRAEHKGKQLEDLRKARFYLDREISKLEKELVNAVPENQR